MAALTHKHPKPVPDSLGTTPPQHCLACCHRMEHTAASGMAGTSRNCARSIDTKPGPRASPVSPVAPCKAGLGPTDTPLKRQGADRKVWC